MESFETRSFNSLVEQYLGSRLPEKMAALISISKLPSDTQAFILRMLALMKRAGYSATSFSPVLIQWLTTSIPNILPSAWGGHIPPLTLPNRHQKLDAYVAGQKWPDKEKPSTFVDLGCGFPPVTTADTARNLPGWRICGVDRSFADFVLYNNDGHYACFDQDGTFQYFQALMNPSGRPLYAAPDATRKQFIELFNELLPLLQTSSQNKSECVHKDGHKLIRNHIRDYETENLTFFQGDISVLKLPPVQVVRCMNVMVYFKPKIRKRMLQKADRLLDQNGLLITGTNGLGIQSRYSVYRKGATGLTPSEFSFSLDNLGHIVFMPWFTLHDNDPEAVLLANLMQTIRNDHHFWEDFSHRLDELLHQHNACKRGPDGFLRFPEKEIPPKEYLQKSISLWQQMGDEGYLTGVVDILGRAGYEAWENGVGDIAIRPVSDFYLN